MNQINIQITSQQQSLPPLAIIIYSDRMYMTEAIISLYCG